MKKLKNMFSFFPHSHFLDFLYEYGKKPVFILFALMLIITTNLKASDPVKIMPVGNSITAGEHFHFPANEERTGYRKDLYEMLVNSGYNVDFVGSQNHGERPITDSNWYDWNNEAYPGAPIYSITEKLNNTLGIYKPDILLVHAGTNGKDWDLKPGQVMEMLDLINKYSVDYDHSITVFLCKIIRFYITYDTGPISKFNNDVADSVAARVGDKIKIIMVDMENGAGLDYTDRLPDTTANPPYEGGDMWGYTYPELVGLDKYHPNDKGNTKMALKFYKELVKELDPVKEIENNTVEGIELFVSPDSTINISWTTNFLDEDGYIIERADSVDGFSKADTVNANTFNFIDSTANITKEYRYRVKAFSESGESLYSSEVSYVPIYWKLTTSVIGQGNISPDSGSYLVVTIPKITLTATPAQGWEFDKWISDVSFNKRSNPTMVTVSSDLSVTANFVEIPSQVSTLTKSEYLFYPNPVVNNLVIESKNGFSQNAVIQLFDNTGRLIINKKVQGLSHILETGDLSSGIYPIKVSNNNEKPIITQITKQ